MSEKVLKNILGRQISAAVADDAENTLVTDYLPMVNIVKQAEEDFYNKMENSSASRWQIRDWKKRRRHGKRRAPF